MSEGGRTRKTASMLDSRTRSVQRRVNSAQSLGSIRVQCGARVNHVAHGQDGLGGRPVAVNFDTAFDFARSQL